ncbi:AAA family ATPase [Fibrisoma montanum]|uniref:AAA family ATPase n=1 Tax=Fibrisoma montanum TaxID=2305895 RepID=A0A418MFA0_9BACT|nr:sigma-54 dependent transcriptional regulator [Fibrisoma montanum]RIV25474.1 AAA family ATPase [Fibrisoma montanum]
MKILVSWYALSNDFDGNEVQLGGPTCQFHKHFYQHDLHLILSTAAPDEDPKLDRLVNRLLLDYPKRRIEGRGMGVKDPINMPDIKAKVEALLLRISEADQIDLFISPGTPAMQVAWYLCHMNLSLPTRLLQTRASKYTTTGLPELIEIRTEQSSIPVSMVLLEQLQREEDKQTSSFLITETLKPVYERATRVAGTDRVTCLIQGASGTGKENLAKFIHNQSNRANRPFVAINCAAIGDTLLESRLFGYEKGAFTGADKKTVGFFDTAKGGTLFLDEIGDISASMQQTLLRVLQEQEFTPVGATTVRKADVRIIAATHKDLRHECQQGHFRWDLFYRLSVAELRLPTLAEWSLTEKRLLIDHFVVIKQKALRRTKQISFSSASRNVLDAYLFPGNVRELENLIESLYVFADELVNVADLPSWICQPDNAASTFDWQMHEKDLIRRALTYFKGNKTRTLEALGYGSINTLTKKIEQYNLASIVY